MQIERGAEWKFPYPPWRVCIDLIGTTRATLQDIHKHSQWTLRYTPTQFGYTTTLNRATRMRRAGRFIYSVCICFHDLSSYKVCCRVMSFRGVRLHLSDLEAVANFAALSHSICELTMIAGRDYYSFPKRKIQWKNAPWHIFVLAPILVYLLHYDVYSQYECEH